MKKSLAGSTLIMIMFFNFVYMYDLGGSITTPLSDVSIDNLRGNEITGSDSTIQSSDTTIQSKVSTIPSGWSYEKNISLFPYTPQDDYQIKVLLTPTNFDYANANSDGSDIRFFDLANNSLNYWIETWNPLGKSIVWVKVPVAGTSEINMYYGNPSATSESNGDNTFIFFDDFEGATINLAKWTTHNGVYSSTVVSGGVLTVTTDSPNDVNGGAMIGFNDFYFINPGAATYNAITNNSLNFGGLTRGHQLQTKAGAASILVNHAATLYSWSTRDIRWVSDSLVQYNNGSSIITHTNSTCIPDMALGVRILTHATYSGLGYGCSGALRSINVLGEVGRALRTRTYFNCADNGLAPPSIQVDWVAVRETAAIEPFATVSGILSINTPEERNYSQPMGGYYPGTYGFEDQPHGTFGTDIDFIDEFWESVPGSADYVDIAKWGTEVQNHSNFIMIRDAQNSAWTWAVHQFDNPPVSGIIEFYLLTYAAAGTQYFQLRATDDTPAIEMRLTYSVSLINQQYYDGSSWQDIAINVDGSWLHNSISFDCEAGVNGQFNWSISHENGTEVGRVENIEFRNDLNTLDEIYFASNLAGTLSTRYDAFGFSWDPYYNLGDNRYEGLLLNFTAVPGLTDYSYSLDGQPKIPIPGNKVIPMPSSGSHTIQVFGSDLYGSYASEVRSFEIRFLDIITPENTTYNSPMSGYYPATYGFENDVVGIQGTAIEFLDWDYNVPDAYIEIVDEYLGHKNTMRLVDLRTGNIASGAHYFDTPPVAGTIEFYQLAQGTTGAHSISLRAMDDTTAIQMHMNTSSGVGDFRFFDGSSWQKIGNLVVDTWYHHTIVFNCETGVNGTATWIVSYENGTEVGRVENFDFDNDLNVIDKFYFTSHFASSQLHMLYDAFGFSWESYSVGDNLNEGLLISYEPPTPLDWTAYSLDGGPNVTIQGNHTIPLPSVGTHSIQVVGFDSLGIYYRSDVRVFDILSPDPPNISGPNDFSFDFGDVGYSILWSASDSNPSNYTIFQNGTIYKLGTWIATIIASLDGIEEGLHNFTCLVENIYGIQSSDEVWVTVLPGAPDTAPPVITSPGDISFEEGSIGYTVIWSGSDNRAPWWAAVWRNTTLIYSQAWVGNDIVISLDGLASSTYFFNCTLTDEAGNSVSDLVKVEVTPAIPDIISPAIIPPATLIYEEGTLGNTLVWICSDAHPFAYRIIKDDSEQVYAPWYGENISFNVDYLPIGSYTFNLTLWDLAGNYASSITSVIVTPPVPDSTPPSISSPAEQSITENMRGSIIWEVFDEHPSVYIIARNGTIVYSESIWVSGILQYSFASLPSGNWIFTLTLWDEAGNTASQDAIVHVLTGSEYDTSPPEITHHPDIVIDFGSTNNSITVSLFDQHPQSYRVYLNELMISEVDWIKPNIQVTVSIDGLSIGTHKLNISAQDVYGNDHFRVIVIEVVGDNTPPNLTSIPDLFLRKPSSHVLKWPVEEEHPDRFKIVDLSNGSVIFLGTWSSNTIEYSLANHIPGTYNLRCVAYDTYGNYAFDDIMVTIEGGGGTPGFEILPSLSLLMISVVILKQKPKRRNKR